MLAVVLEEERQSRLNLLFARPFRQRALDERAGAVADEAEDGVVGEGAEPEVLAGGVDGMSQVELGVDEGAVEVEDENAQAARVKGGRGHRLP